MELSAARPSRGVHGPQGVTVPEVGSPGQRLLDRRCAAAGLRAAGQM